MDGAVTTGTPASASPGVYADLEAQRACWHPAAFSADLTDKPVPSTLLGEPLVLWRGAGGEARASQDLCVHRGTALSLGGIQGDELVCAYHGWRYGADGRCVAIPQKDDPAAVPAKARVRVFGAQERYGLIWAALEEPRWPLPEVPGHARVTTGGREATSGPGNPGQSHSGLPDRPASRTMRLARRSVRWVVRQT